MSLPTLPRPSGIPSVSADLLYVQRSMDRVIREAADEALSGRADDRHVLLGLCILAVECSEGVADDRARIRAQHGGEDDDWRPNPRTVQAYSELGGRVYGEARGLMKVMLDEARTRHDAAREELGF